jgi:hypothetical protein
MQHNRRHAWGRVGFRNVRCENWVALDAAGTTTQPTTTDSDWLDAWHSACPLLQHWYGRHIDAAQSPATPWSGRRSGSVDSISLARCQLLVTEDPENLNEPATVRANLMGSDMTSWQEGGALRRSSYFSPLHTLWNFVLGTWNCAYRGTRKIDLRLRYISAILKAFKQVYGARLVTILLYTPL